MIAVMLGMIVGGFCAIYLLSSLINWLIVKRIVYDPAHQIWASVGAAFLLALLIQFYEGDLGTVRAIPIVVSGALAAALVVMGKYFPLRKGPTDFLRVSITAAASFVVPGIVLYVASPVVAAPLLSAQGQADARQPDQVSLDLRAMAVGLNEETPKMVDKETKLLRASVTGRVFTYHYKFLKPIRVSDPVFLARMRAILLPKVCANTDMRHDVDENEVTYEYAYAVPGRSNELVLSVDKAACLA